LATIEHGAVGRTDTPFTKSIHARDRWRHHVAGVLSALRRGVDRLANPADIGLRRSFVKSGSVVL
jgi:riboflavin synthase